MGVFVKVRTLLAGAAIAAAASGVMAGSADAKIMNVVYTGTVSDTHDLSGIFGLAPSGLDGLSFTANFTYDTTRGEDRPDPFGGPGQGLEGSASSGASNPITSASLTLNGVTFQFLTTDEGHTDVGNYSALFGGPVGVIENNDVYNAQIDDVQYYQYLYAGVINGSAPTMLGVPFSGGPSGPAAGSTSGSFSLSTQVLLPTDYFTVDTSGTLNIDSVTVTEAGGDISAAPEPAGWALMLIGFGALGAGLRRRRAGLVAA